ncbi:hypothetical protein F4781DRAFT_435102 [Annulohypoxylon bovei var. microspora]|nr:hypothetical protein F4781DRAFT_435102 [Annulohypoxylon bovei var. microspora]
MPTDSKRLGRLGGSGGSYSTQARSLSVPARPAIRETRMKQPRTPDPKSRPAVKDLTRNRSKSRSAIKESSSSRPKPISSQAAGSRGKAAATQYTSPVGTKAPGSAHNRSHLQAPEPPAKGATPKARNPAATLNDYSQTPHSGRQDPYDIPSDSEDDDRRGRKLTSVAVGRKSVMPSNKRASSVGPRKKHGSVLSSTPIKAVAKPSAPLASSLRTRVPGGPRRSWSHIPVPVPLGAQIISVDSSSNETSSRYVPPTGHPASEHKSGGDTSAPARVAASPTVITIDDSSRNEVESSFGSPPRPRSTAARGPAFFSRTPSGIPKGAEVVSLTGSSSQSSEEDSDLVPTPVKPSAKAIGKRSSHSVNSHLKFLDKNHRDATRVLEESSSAKKDSRVGIGNHPKRRSAQTKSKGSKEAGRRNVGSEIPSSYRAAIDGVKKTMKIKFEKKATDKPIPESFFEETEYTDDEYQPPSSNEAPSSDERDNNPPSPQQSRAITPKSSQISPGRTLRSGSYPKPPISFTPINKLALRVHKRESSPKLPIRSSKFGRGYSKRVRDAFSDASISRGSEDETNEEQADVNTTLQSSPDSKRDGEESVAARPADSARKPWWSPHLWMEKYETLFMPGRDGRVWLADGPFKGWILEGLGAGGYIPGCKEPDDETLVEAEKTATLRWPSRWAEFESDSDDDDTSDAEGSHEEEASTEQITSGVPGDAALVNIQRPPTGDSKARSRHESPSPDISPKVPRRASPRAKVKDKAAVRADYMERTKQYVLAGGSDNNIGARQITNPPKPNGTITREEFPTSLTPATAPQGALSPPSVESETTSTLITQQLIDDCAPPSNQELAELMSSSPATRLANASSPVRKTDELAESDDDQTSSSSSEPSSGIPAHISPKPRLQSPEIPRTRDASYGLEHVNAAHILGGIAGRRTTRSLTSLLPSIVQSNEPAHDVERPSANATPESPTQPKEDLTKTKIVVEVPGLTMEEQAEYDAVSPTPEIEKLSTLSPKSFKEINEATSRVDTASNDPDAEQALKYVLRQSPKWLAGFTETNEADDMATDVPKPLSKSLAAAKPFAPDLDNTVSRESHPTASETAAPAPVPVHSSTTTCKKVCEGVEEGSRAKKRRKRKAPVSDVSVVDESPLSKRQKVDDDQGHAKKKHLSYRQRKRLQKRLKNQQQRGDRVQQRIGTAIGNSVNVGSQSTVTPPTSSRPTSSEAK